MEELEPYFKKLKDDIQLLIKGYDHLQKENKLLKTKFEDQKAVMSANSEKINLLQQKIDAGKLGIQNLTTEDKIKLKERIDYYLSDIEKCLALLNS